MHQLERAEITGPMFFVIIGALIGFMLPSKTAYLTRALDHLLPLIEFSISQSKPLSLLLLVSQPSPIFFALPGAKIFSAFPKCSLLQATTEAPFKSEVKLTILLPKLLFFLEIFP